MKRWLYHVAEKSGKWNAGMPHVLLIEYSGTSRLSVQPKNAKNVNTDQLKMSIFLVIPLSVIAYV